MTPQAQDYSQVRKDIASIIKQPTYDDGSAGPVLVRLAWHASGTYDKNTGTGGSDGAGMRYEKEGGDPANNGLQVCTLLPFLILLLSYHTASTVHHPPSTNHRGRSPLVQPTTTIEI